jgi:hypothetical protein
MTVSDLKPVMNIYPLGTHRATIYDFCVANNETERHLSLERRQTLDSFIFCLFSVMWIVKSWSCIHSHWSYLEKSKSALFYLFIVESDAALVISLIQIRLELLWRKHKIIPENMAPINQWSFLRRFFICLWIWVECLGLEESVWRIVSAICLVPGTHLLSWPTSITFFLRHFHFKWSSLWCSWYLFGGSEPQIWWLCVFKISDMWDVATLENMTLLGQLSSSLS